MRQNALDYFHIKLGFSQSQWCNLVNLLCYCLADHWTTVWLDHRFVKLHLFWTLSVAHACQCFSVNSGIYWHIWYNLICNWNVIVNLCTYNFYITSLSISCLPINLYCSMSHFCDKTQAVLATSVKYVVI